MRYRLKCEETGRLGHALFSELGKARKYARAEAAFLSRHHGRRVGVSVVTEGGLYLTRGGMRDASLTNVRVRRV